MAAVAEVGSSLLSKCLDLCQALCSQGQAFNFSVTIGQDFTFSMDTRSKEVSPVTVVKKKASPSTMRRNALRRQEFLKKKRSPSSKNSCEVETVSDAPSCDQCDYKAASEKGLKQHKRMKHKASKLASSENSAKQDTPEKEILREELEDSCNISQPSEMRDEEILSVNADISITDTTLVLPHYCGPNPERPEDDSDQSVFACGDCCHIWRNKEEVQNCSCTNLHDCSPYCLYVDVLSKDNTVT